MGASSCPCMADLPARLQHRRLSLRTLRRTHQINLTGAAETPAKLDRPPQLSRASTQRTICQLRQETPRLRQVRRLGEERRAATLPFCVRTLTDSLRGERNSGYVSSNKKDIPRSDDAPMTIAHTIGVGRGLEHLPFIEEMATLDEGDPAALTTRTGFLVLRFIDVWMEDRAFVDAADSRAARAVRTSVEQISANIPIRTILTNVLDAMVDPNAQSGPTVWQHLMLYGRALDLDAQWKLALDVYDTLLEYVPLKEDNESVVNALLRRASCLRDLGRFDDADAAYSVASQQAKQCANVRGALRAQIGKSKLQFARGNVPLADAILVETIRAANEFSVAEVRSLAMHARAQIADVRGEYDVAIRYQYAALRESITESERDRILADIAGEFYKLGVRSTTRDVFLILAATAREQAQRWSSAINLMEIAATDGSRLQFEQYRHELVGAPLPPHLRVEFELHVGRGYQLLSEFDSARQWLERAIRSASAYSLNRLLFEADHALANNNVAWNTREIAPTPVLDNDIVQIADELRALRELALSVKQ
jgi:tetratricopeptide (TPR) repeat protein